MKHDFLNIVQIKKILGFQSKPPADQTMSGNSFADDPFVSDAIDGYTGFPEALNDLTSLKNEFNNRTNVKQVKPHTNLKFIISVSIIIGISIFAIVFGSKEINKSILKSGNQKNNELNSGVHQNKTSVPISDIEILDSKELAKEKQITYIVAVKNQPQTILKSKSENEQLVPIVGKRVHLNSENIADIEKEKLIEKSKISYSNFPVKYIHDLKVVDYTKAHRPKINLNSGIGLDAKYENKDYFSNKTGDLNNENISYVSFLESAIQRFADNDFKGALRDFNTILNQYPDDLNALFYGGLCLFNLQKYLRANDSFDKAIDNSINSFYQEAKWYKALSLFQNGDVVSTKNILGEIIKEDGFYKTKAEQKLKQIEK